ncbi:unnamed protein product [Pedinophyceae sp. YPF-701]|nr:unnamed protein product [Pedinophyceae sp. YPF-701]
MTGRPLALLLLVLGAVLLLGRVVEGIDYERGDFVSVSSRAQYGGKRTKWQDLLWRHCPKFGQNAVVAVPVPEPFEWSPGDTYKIMLGFDNHRVHTTWAEVLGRSLRQRFPKKDLLVPMLEVSFDFAGKNIRAVRSQVVPVPQDYLPAHPTLIGEFQNDGVWPKHVLIRYTWRDVSGVDVHVGLYLVFVVGGLPAVALMVKALLASNVTQLLEDTEEEDDQGVLDEGIERDVSQAVTHTGTSQGLTHQRHAAARSPAAAAPPPMMAPAPGGNAPLPPPIGTRRPLPAQPARGIKAD